MPAPGLPAGPPRAPYRRPASAPVTGRQPAQSQRRAVGRRGGRAAGGAGARVPRRLRRRGRAPVAVARRHHGRLSPRGRLPLPSARARRRAGHPVRRRPARRAVGARLRARGCAGRHAPGQPLRRGGRVRARPWPRRRLGCRWSAASRSASTRLPTAAVSTAVACRSRCSPAGRTSSTRGVTAPPPARARRRDGPLGAAAGHRAVPVELPRPKPDHGRARPADRGGRSGAAQRQPDHLGLRASDLGRSVAAVPGRVTSSLRARHQWPAARRRRAGHRTPGRARRAVRR